MTITKPKNFFSKKIREKLTFFLLLLKLRSADIISYILVPIFGLIYFVKRKKIKTKSYTIWLIYTSKYQYDIGSTILKERYKVD